MLQILLGRQWGSNAEENDCNCCLKCRCLLCNDNSLEHKSFILYFNSARASSQHLIMSLYMRATRDGKSIRITKSTLWKYNLSEKHLMVVFFFSLFLLSLPTLQMNLKPFWSACPPIASWMCPSLPSSGQLTCHSRSGIRSLSPAPPWYWEKPRRLSGNCSPWANAALNNLTSVYPERGNPQCYSDPKHLNEWGRRCSFGRRTASHKQSKLANL